ADLAVDQVHGQAARMAFLGGGLELGARLDAQLFGQAPLVGGQAEVGGEQRRLALADHLDQVQLRQRVRIAQRLHALEVELDRNRIERAGVDRRAHRVEAVARDVRGAEQGVADAVAFDDGVRLAGEGVDDGGGYGFLVHRGRAVRVVATATPRRGRAA